MKTQIILRGKTIEPIIEVDGKIVPCKLDKSGNRVYDILTKTAVARIKIYSLKHELSEKHWWLFAFLFYIVSICGIFNTFYSKKFFTLYYEGYLKNYSATLDLRLNNGKTGDKAIECISGVFDENTTNVYGFDEKAKKRRKLLLILKLISWVVIAAIITIVLINKK